jgi:hypothetical protein
MSDDPSYSAESLGVEVTHKASRVGHLAHQTVVALSVVTVALVLVGSIIVWSELRTDTPWSPLHYTNPQTVTSRVNILSGAPATHIGDTVNVTAEKCSDERVDITAVVTWRPVEPGGPPLQIAGETAGGVREAGCDTLRFQNEIPDEVVEAVRRQHARGYPAPLWRIDGAETPYDEHGREGSVEVWTTEPFAIVARAA